MQFFFYQNEVHVITTRLADLKKHQALDLFCFLTIFMIFKKINKKKQTLILRNFENHQVQILFVVFSLMASGNNDRDDNTY